MNIDNNIGGSAYQNRSQHIEKQQTDTAAAETQTTTFNGSSISFVNVLQSTSLVNVLWAMKKDVPTESSTQSAAFDASSQASEAAWLRQAYTEH